MPPPNSALDPFRALDTGWPDKMEEQWPSKEKVAACEFEPANKDQVAHTKDETEKQKPDSTEIDYNMH